MMIKKTNKQIFKMPLLLGVLIMLALVAALMVDGSILEQLSLLSLCAPIVIAAYFYWFKKW